MQSFFGATALPTTKSACKQIIHQSPCMRCPASSSAVALVLWARQQSSASCRCVTGWGGSSQCVFVCAIDCFRLQSRGLPMRACDTPNLSNRPSASSTLTVTIAPHSSATSARWLRSCSGSSRVKRLWIGDGRGCVCVWVCGPELQAAVKTMRVCDLEHFKNRPEASTGIPKQYCSHGDIHGHKVPALIGSKPSLTSIILACHFSASKGFKHSAAGADVVSCDGENPDRKTQNCVSAFRSGWSLDLRNSDAPAPQPGS